MRKYLSPVDYKAQSDKKCKMEKFQGDFHVKATK
jgi:hypothetical protein